MLHKNIFCSDTGYWSRNSPPTKPYFDVLVAQSILLDRIVTPIRIKNDWVDAYAFYKENKSPTNISHPLSVMCFWSKFHSLHQITLS